jgi:dinuclear metal center YbgI/SA1388 family protein
MALKSEIVRFLDDFLKVREVEDPYTRNGLVVDGPEEVTRIAFAVDACLAAFDAAAGLGAQMVVTHHGLFWPSTAAVTGELYGRIATLIRGGVSLYSCHLPLDAHETVGNNIGIVKALGALDGGPFDGYCRYGDFPEPLPRDLFADRVRTVIGPGAVLLPFGPDAIRRVAICSGGGADHLFSIKDDPGVDCFLTGEAVHHVHHLARENGLNVVFAGHYATEVFGVKALAKVVGERFGVVCDFIDLPTGL